MIEQNANAFDNPIFINPSTGSAKWPPIKSLLGKPIIGNREYVNISKTKKEKIIIIFFLIPLGLNTHKNTTETNDIESVNPAP